jgi:iron complex transport system substrate-binding protein
MTNRQHAPSTRRSFVAGTGLGLAALGASRPGSILAQGTPGASPVAGGTRTLSHAMGNTEIPANPQRVVVLDGPVLDACFALGITPVGATTGVADAPWPAYLGPGTAGIANVGDIAEPNLEKIAALEPDLIISLSFRHEAIYEQLSGIAPTVLSPFDSAGWRDGFLFYADALNRNAEAPAIVAAFDARTAELTANLGETIEETTVSVIRVLTGEVRSYQASSFSGIVLEAVGLPRPESQQGTEDTWLPQSMEQLNEVDASVIFVTLWSGSTQDDLNQLLDNPLWATLSAVQANTVYQVPDEYWMTAIGYLAANLILDDLQLYLVEGAPPPAVG